MLTGCGQQDSFLRHEQMFFWKCQSFWEKKCLYLRETRTPNLWINAECSDHLSYQGQTFAVPCFYIYPLLQRSWKGVYWFHLVCLSVCGQNRVLSVSSTIRVGSISHLHILSRNFRKCVACNICFKIQYLKFWRILKICNFDFVFFWLGIQFDSIEQVIMRRRRVSSERRCSSHSCLILALAEKWEKKLLMSLLAKNYVVDSIKQAANVICFARFI